MANIKRCELNKDTWKVNVIVFTFALITSPPIFPMLLGSLNSEGPSFIPSPFTSVAETFFRDNAKFAVLMTKSSDGTRRPKKASLMLLNFSDAAFTNYRERHVLLLKVFFMFTIKSDNIDYFVHTFLFC